MRCLGESGEFRPRGLPRESPAMLGFPRAFLQTFQRSGNELRCSSGHPRVVPGESQGALNPLGHNIVMHLSNLQLPGGSVGVLGGIWDSMSSPGYNFLMPVSNVPICACMHACVRYAAMTAASSVGAPIPTSGVVVFCAVSSPLMAPH